MIEDGLIRMGGSGEGARAIESFSRARRHFLFNAAQGFGGLALSVLAAQESRAGTASPALSKAPYWGSIQPKARSVIFLYMDGGPSQVDTFDPKPRLDKEHGEPIKMNTPRTQFNIGNRVLKSPFRFSRYGQSGTPVSDLFPNVARHVDDLAIIRSMVSDHSEHTAGNYFMHTGFAMQGRPSMGSWITYGLGSESSDLPGFVVMDSGLIPPGGVDMFGSGFLPATFQASLFRRGPLPIADLERREPNADIQRAKLDLVRDLHRQSTARLGAHSDLDAMIANYELAARMQLSVPTVADLNQETALTRTLYGLDNKETAEFGRQCLIARRMVERGVRFVELLPPFRQGLDRWDQHGNLAHGHRVNSLAVDQPIAALLTDLKARGLFEQTLVIWGGEFGRTPMAQGGDGRDHNPFGFTMWLAGGGIKGGTIHGSTDEYGYFVRDGKVHVHDLHATILYLLGVDHTKLTYRYSGRDFRLTDVHGHVIHDVLA